MTPQEIQQRIELVEKDLKSGKISFDFAEEQVKEYLKNYRGEDRVVLLKDYPIPVVDEKNSFFSGVEKLDNIFGKFHKGDIFTITGITNHGKSAFARELCIRFAEQKKQCLFFPYEDTPYWFLKKIGDHLDRNYSCMPIAMNERSIVWIEARILESILKFNTEIVFIDNVKSITQYQSNNVNNSIELTMQKIKEIAIKYNILIFLCAHTKKERGDLDINSIKDSSAIADISSLVLTVKREIKNGEDTGITYFSVIKNRNNGRLKGFAMEFKPDEKDNFMSISGRFGDTEIEEIVKEVNSLKLV